MDLALFWRFAELSGFLDALLEVSVEELLEIRGDASLLRAFREKYFSVVDRSSRTFSECMGALWDALGDEQREQRELMRKFYRDRQIPLWGAMNDLSLQADVAGILRPKTSTQNALKKVIMEPEQLPIIALHDELVSRYRENLEKKMNNGTRSARSGRLRRDGSDVTVVEADTISIKEIAECVDIAVLTIRTDEFEAVLKRFPNRKLVPDGRRLYDYAKVDNKLGVAFVRFPAQGQGIAQAVTRDVIDDLNPAWLFLVGIGGGIPDGEYSLGDVVVATRFEDFSVSAAIQGMPTEHSNAGAPMHPDVQSLLSHLPSQKHRMRGWGTQKFIGKKKPNVVVPDDIDASEFYGDDEWRSEVQRSLQTNFPNDKKHRPSKMRTAPIITSDLLLKDTTLLKQWRQVARHAEAVEMEVGGVYLAASHGGIRDYRIVAIRGLSDIVGFKRSGDWTTYACHAAAAFCNALIRSGLIGPSGKRTPTSGN